MIRHFAALLALVTLLAPITSRGQSGKVIEVPQSGDIVVQRSADDQPEQGAEVDVFFLLPGINEKSRRATGKITRVEDGQFTVKINRATQTSQVKIGDLVEITSPAPIAPAPVAPAPVAPAPVIPPPVTTPPSREMPPDLPEDPAEQGFFGVLVEQIPDAKARSLGLKTGGLRVSGVTENSPATVAGVQVDDIIIAFAGMDTLTVSGFVEAVIGTRPGSRVSCVVFRNGGKREMDVKIARRPADSDVVFPSAKPVLRKVPDDYSSIQSAVDAANRGDIIFVKSGVYTELLTIKTGGIEIRGEARTSTILRFPHGIERNSADLVLISGVDDVQLSELSLEWPLSGVGSERAEDVDPLEEFIKLDGGSLTVSNCHFEGREEVNGIRFFNGNLSITGSRFNQCVFGIGAGKEASIRIEDCFVLNSKRAGIVIQDGARGFVKGCTVQSSGTDGILVLGEESKAEVIGNKSLKNLQSGIKFNLVSAGLVTGNECTDNHVSGITALGEGTSPTIENNRCHSNGLHGIGIGMGCRSVVKGNHCHNNKECGILADGGSSKPSIVENLCNDNGHFGIAVESDCFPAEFRDNTASGNKLGQINRKAVIKR